MAEIHIVVPDAALRNALTETIDFTRAGTTQETADFSVALKDSEAAALILDEAAADKKAFRLFAESARDNSRCRIYILGDADPSWKDHLAVEHFPKPLRLGHLLTRLMLHMRTGAKNRNVSITFGPWRLELQNRQITREADGIVIRLTEKETALLDYLAQSEIPVGREELLAAIWGHDGRIDTHTLETHIYQLRRKLDPDGQGLSLLVNEQGAYRLNAT